MISKDLEILFNNLALLLLAIKTICFNNNLIANIYIIAIINKTINNILNVAFSIYLNLLKDNFLANNF